MNWKETHTDIQTTIEGRVTNGISFHNCEYETRESKDPENDLSLQIHLGLLKSRTVGLDGEEKSILDGLRFMSREIFSTGAGEFLQFDGHEGVEVALERFINSRPELDNTSLGLMYRNRRAISPFLEFLKTT